MKSLLTLAYLLLVGSSAPADETSVEGLKRSFAAAEIRLDGLTGRVTASATNAAGEKIGGPNGQLGTFDWQFRKGELTLLRHVAGADLQGIRGARDVVTRVRGPQVTWYEVYTEDPGVGGIGDVSQSSHYSWPLIGRAVNGTPFSKILGTMSAAAIRSAADEITLVGQRDGHSITATLRPSLDYLVTDYEDRSPARKGRHSFYRFHVLDSVKTAATVSPLRAKVEVGVEEDPGSMLAFQVTWESTRISSTALAVPPMTPARCSSTAPSRRCTAPVRTANWSTSNASARGRERRFRTGPSSPPSRRWPL